MKEVYILEHASAHEESLTNQGKQECLALKQRVPQFNIVISSREEANQVTAKTITGKKPIVDSRAGGLKTLNWWEKKAAKPPTIFLPGQYGGVQHTELYRKPSQEAGEKLIELVKEILKKLPKDGKALIISHNRNMIAAEAIIHKERLVAQDHTFHGLQGFMIDEQFEFHPIEVFP